MSESIDWNTLTHGQRNRLVAEKIMGWQPKECDGEVWEISGGWQCSDCGLSGDWTGKDFDRFASHIQLPPRYSESVDAAMLVIKKMRNDYQGLWHITVYPDDATTPNVVTLTIKHKEVGYRGAFLAEAICIAALHAVNE